MTGKEKCEFLKKIRKQIAEEYNIPYFPSECKHEGDCLGTCPKCEAELEYLNNEIEAKKAEGFNLNIIADLSELFCISHEDNLFNDPTPLCGEALYDSLPSDNELTSGAATDIIPLDDFAVTPEEESVPLMGDVVIDSTDSEVQADKIYREIQYIISEYGYEEIDRIDAKIETLENELKDLRKRKKEIKKRQLSNANKFDKYFSDLAKLMKKDLE